jgi:hypothetical protein
LAWPCCCASVERHLLHCMSPFMARAHRRNLDLTASLLRKLPKGRRGKVTHFRLRQCESRGPRLRPLSIISTGGLQEGDPRRASIRAIRPHAGHRRGWPGAPAL